MQTDQLGLRGQCVRRRTARAPGSAHFNSFALFLRCAGSASTTQLSVPSLSVRYTGTTDGYISSTRARAPGFRASGNQGVELCTKLYTAAGHKFISP